METVRRCAGTEAGCTQAARCNASACTPSTGSTGAAYPGTGLPGHRPTGAPAHWRTGAPAHRLPANPPRGRGGGWRTSASAPPRSRPSPTFPTARRSWCTASGRRRRGRPTACWRCAERGVKDLTVICNTPAGGPTSLNILAEKQQIRKLICSYVSLADRCRRRSREQVKAGEIELEMVPQGTLIERVRAGGAGLAGVLHADRRRHRHRRGQGGARVRRQALPASSAPSAPTSRLLQAHQADARRQPHLPPRHAQLRPGLRDGGDDHHRRGARRSSPSARSTPRRRDARHLRRPHRHAPRRTSTSACCARSCMIGRPHDATWTAARCATAARRACRPT